MTRRSARLDGIRGVAIALVLCHSLLVLDSADGLVAYVLEFTFDRGWLGVQLFFVLSGFLITGILLDTRGEPNHYASFFSRRALRILPLYCAFLLVLVVVLPLASVIAPIERPTWPYWLFLVDITPAPHARLPALSHLWSLAVEEQFYLAWPFFIRRLSLRQVFVASVAIAVASFAIRCAMRAAGMNPEAVYTHPLARMDALACGAAVATALRMRLWPRLTPRRLEVLAAALAALAIIATHGLGRTSLSTQTFGYSLMSLAFALWIGASARADGLGAPLSAPRLTGALAVLGQYSYAIYLFHRPLHVLVGAPWLASLGEGPTRSIGFALGYIVFVGGSALLMAMLSYRALEAPFLRMKDRWRTEAMTT